MTLKFRNVNLEDKEAALHSNVKMRGAQLTLPAITTAHGSKPPDTPLSFTGTSSRRAFPLQRRSWPERRNNSVSRGSWYAGQIPLHIDMRTSSYP